MAKHLPIILVLSFALALSACSSRQRVSPGTVPEPPKASHEDEQYGQNVLNSLVERYPLSTSDEYINRARDIVDRLSRHATSKPTVWHVYVLDGDEFKNAAATRGNFIFIWTGMLKTVRNDDELATTLAHEMGHVLANHPKPSPAEDTSRIVSGVAGNVARQAISIQGGAVGALAGLGEMLAKLTMNALLVYPEQQRKELEADHIGLFLMADAGYNPEEAIRFWERVQGDPVFSGLPIEFLSTHPSSKERLEALRRHLPEASRRYSERYGQNREKYRRKSR
jgi:predicted Zn-dependent protease